MHQATLDLPAAGVSGDTYATSKAAAESVAGTAATQRERVFAYICSREDGATDDEIQAALGLEGSTERPRRLELWERHLIRIKRDAEFYALKRPTRSGRRAVVWERAA